MFVPAAPAYTSSSSPFVRQLQQQQQRLLHGTARRLWSLSPSPSFTCPRRQANHSLAARHCCGVVPSRGLVLLASAASAPAPSATGSLGGTLTRPGRRALPGGSSTPGRSTTTTTCGRSISSSSIRSSSSAATPAAPVGAEPRPSAGASARTRTSTTARDFSARTSGGGALAAAATPGFHMGLRAPPPPSSSHRINTSFASAAATTANPLLSSSPSQISSQRTAQIARHLASPASTRQLHSTSSSASSASPTMASPYNLRKVAAANTLEHRVYIEKDGVPVSPFHDIPLYANQEQTILNMVVEIPRWTNAKLEISKEELLNPIKQDIKKGKLRYVRNCFPHKGYLWNYGAFPQTWEDPNVVHPETKAKGDNDPLDVCEIGELVGYTGQVKQVKVLGVMALLDEEETDWKVIVIDVNDPLAPKLNDIEDVERHLPGLLRATNEWFRIYKIPDGKPENQFAFTGECKNKSYAMDVIRECGEAWERLITGKTPAGGVSIANTTVSRSQGRLAPEQLPALPPNQDLPPEKIDSSIDKWFFISGASA
ncbi:hypothetical protein Purlil1_2533 [Purpureocillium lilacinum]|uniref:inorganic diphosphatase n=1 Tax=Purpureocillium lilacinum TaxID=33203 RepID=A0ABR0CBS4_PURLI|nr:hypothetical protein Purlil1_2533 [Purpureocillium lilacinum]